MAARCIFPPRCFKPHTIIHTEDAIVELRHPQTMSDELAHRLGEEGHSLDFSVSATPPLVFTCAKCGVVKPHTEAAGQGRGGFICKGCAPVVAGGQGRSARAIVEAGRVLNCVLLALMALGVAGLAAVVGKVAAAVLFS